MCIQNQSSGTDDVHALPRKEDQAVVKLVIQFNGMFELHETACICIYTYLYKFHL